MCAQQYCMLKEPSAEDVCQRDSEKIRPHGELKSFHITEHAATLSNLPNMWRLYFVQYGLCPQEVMSSHLVAAWASGPGRLAIMSSTEQLLIGPEVDQVHQRLAALGTREAGGMPQSAVVTCALSINCWRLFGNLTLATSAALGNREERRERAGVTSVFTANHIIHWIIIKYNMKTSELPKNQNLKKVSFLLL